MSSWELKGSLHCLKEPTSGHYPDPDELNSPPFAQFLLRFILMPFYLRVGLYMLLPNWSVRKNILYPHIVSSIRLRATPMSPYLIWHPYTNVARSINYGTPHALVFILLSLPSSVPDVLLSSGPSTATSLRSSHMWDHVAHKINTKAQRNYTRYADLI